MSGVPGLWPVFAIGLLLIGIFLLGTLYYRQRCKSSLEARTEAESRAETSEALLASAPGAYLSFSGEGPDAMTASPALVSMLGLSQQGPLDSDTLNSAIHPEDAESLLTAIGDYRRGGSTFACRARTRDGARTF